MELLSFHTSPSISEHSTIFFHAQRSPYSTTTSSSITVWKSRACFILHQRPCILQFKDNGRRRCSRAEISPVSEETSGNTKGLSFRRGEETDSSEDEDPNWPEEGEDGWGFPLSEFFNDIKIMNVKNNDDDEDLDYLTEDEIKWQDDSVDAAVKDITAKDWEDTVFGDIGHLVVLVYERYHRPSQNMKVRKELDKAINVFWDVGKPAPRAVKFEATEETDLASSLKVKNTPVVIFIKDGKLVHRQTEILMADELAKIMAYFYYGANRPGCLKPEKLVEEEVPTLA